MIYLTQMLGNPVIDSDGEELGKVNDLGIATGEVFPRVTSVSFQSRGGRPLMISWRKYVGSFDEDAVRLKVSATDLRFSYLQPSEVLIARDLLNKQIVDTRGMRVVRVNDLKLSDTNSTQLRLLGAEVGIRGILRAISPRLEKLVLRIAKIFGHTIPERIIAWNYMDLLDRDLSDVKLSVSHKTLDDMHPADIADIIERLDPRLRGQVFAQLDDERAADAMAEIDDDMAGDIMDDMTDADASRMLSEMDPDDAAELVSELDYDRAEKLLRLMGVEEQTAIRKLLGYREDTAGRIMTSEVVSLPEEATVAEAVDALKGLDEDFETVHYIYVHDADGRLTGVVSLNRIVVSDPQTRLSDIAATDLVTAGPDDDQEDVAEDIAKYNLLAMPVVDDDRKLLGIVTVDDALDVMDEEHEEDLKIAGASTDSDSDGHEGAHDLLWLLRNEAWFLFWMAGVVIVALLLAPQVGLARAMLVTAALPIALVAADDAITYVTNFFLEYDEDDEDAPSTLGFTLKGIGLGLMLAAVVSLVVAGVGQMLGAGSATITTGFKGFESAAAAIIVSFATTPIYLEVLRKRDDANKDTSGIALSVVSMCVALAIFVACAWFLMNGMAA